MLPSAANNLTSGSIRATLTRAFGISDAFKCNVRLAKLRTTLSIPFGILQFLLYFVRAYGAVKIVNTKSLFLNSFHIATLLGYRSFAADRVGLC